MLKETESLNYLRVMKTVLLTLVKVRKLWYENLLSHHRAPTCSVSRDFLLFEINSNFRETLKLKIRLNAKNHAYLLFQSF